MGDLTEAACLDLFNANNWKMDSIPAILGAKVSGFSKCPGNIKTTPVEDVEARLEFAEQEGQWAMKGLPDSTRAIGAGGATPAILLDLDLAGRHDAS